MKAPLLPPDEASRQDAVDALKLTSEISEASLDRITRLLATLVDVPISAFSVIDNDRQFFKSAQGLGEVRETPRDVSFCGHAILDDDIMVVEDAQGDERFADNPLVTGDPRIRFYAGIPVMSPTGRKVGTLCAIDRKQRVLTERERQALVDLRALLESELVLRTVSVKDHLTDLFNRRYFDEIISREWRRALRLTTPVALMLIDVDRFKDYNDTYGHSAGDRCLQQIANVLKQAGRRAGDVIGRFGGEEFAAILPDITAEGAMTVGENIRAGVEALGIEHSELPGRVITVSVGISMARTSDELTLGFAHFINRADEAMYLAKRSGRNQVLMDPQVLGEAPDTGK